jgi:cob(I)alamin adenosyltransferase
LDRFIALGHRLTKIYTRTGDNGTTGLADGSRIAKDHPRLEAIGDLDELNSIIGIILCHPLHGEVRNCLIDIQHLLFDIGAELSVPGRETLTIANVTSLEKLLDEFNAGLPPLKEFILPGGNPAAATSHLARAVCRRAERNLVRLDHHETVNQHTLAYINRLSDLLFVIARLVSRETDPNEVQWKKSTNR